MGKRCTWCGSDLTGRCPDGSDHRPERYPGEHETKVAKLVGRGYTADELGLAP